MLKPQLPNTCNAFLTDTSNNVNVMVLMKGFYHRPLNVIQIVIIRHKPFKFLGIALSFNSSQACSFSGWQRCISSRHKSQNLWAKAKKKKKKKSHGESVEMKWDDNDCLYKKMTSIIMCLVFLAPTDTRERDGHLGYHCWTGRCYLGAIDKQRWEKA